MQLHKGAAELVENIPVRAASPEAVAALIDHTLLKPEATAAQIRKLCREALEFGFAAVCVNPAWVPLCASELAGSRVKRRLRGRFPARRYYDRSQGARDGRGGALRRARNRHGDPYRRAALRANSTS